MDQPDTRIGKLLDESLGIEIRTIRHGDHLPVFVTLPLHGQQEQLQPVGWIFHPHRHRHEGFGIHRNARGLQKESVKTLIIGPVAKNRPGISLVDLHRRRDNGLAAPDANLALYDQVWQTGMRWKNDKMLLGVFPCRSPHNAVALR